MCVILLCFIVFSHSSELMYVCMFYSTFVALRLRPVSFLINEYVMCYVMHLHILISLVCHVLRSVSNRLQTSYHKFVTLKTTRCDK